ncbi:MAG: PKD domain-containing protein [Flavobacteriales bacterium]
MRFSLLLTLTFLGSFAIGQCSLSLTSSAIDCNSFAFHIQGADVGNVSWNYGDGSFGTSNVNSDHNYASNGTYIVTATYSGPACPNGMMLTTTVDVACATEPICPTQITATAIDCDSYLFTIAGATEGQVAWDFGDNVQLPGGVSAEHTYGGNGVFIVTANYFGPTCQAGILLIATVQINCLVETVCPTEIVVQNTTMCQMPLFLLNTPAQDGETVVWYPGDGTAAVNGGHGFEHMYSNPGTYDVCAYYTSASCPNGTEICTSVVVEACPSPACPESLVAEAMDCNTSVFHITGIDGVQVNWNFGDGTLLTGTTTAEHTYASNGIYVVYAIVIAPDCPQANPNGVLTFVYTVQINCAQNECPTSLWSGPSATCQTMQFEVGAASPDVSVTWYPGDDSGPITGGYFLEHAYTNPGIYSVCAYYTSSACPSGIELCTDIVVEACQQPTCPSEIIPTTGANCGNYFFELNSTSSEAVVTWYPVDESGAVQTAGAFEHSYANPGTYQVCAWVVSPVCPNGAELCTSIVVAPCDTPCQEGVLAVNSYLLQGGTNALVYSLYSDNGFQVSGEATYTENDPYFDLPVCLPDGCYHLTLDNNNPLIIGQGVSLSLVINSVNVLENAEIIYQDNVSITYLFGVNTDCSVPVCEALFNAIYTATPGHLEFENTSIYGGSATFSWSYGDGQTSDGFAGNVQYSSNGLYEVCLTVTTPNCTNTYCIPVLIDNMPAGCEQNNIVINISANQLPDVTDVIGLSLLFDGQVIEAWSLLVQNGFSATYELCVPDGCYEIGCSSVMPLAAEAFNVTVGSNGTTIGNLQLTMGGSEAMAVFGVNTDCTIGLNEEQATTWSVYPNPAEDQIHLVFEPLDDVKTISLIDASGRTIGTWSTSQNQFSLDVREFASGFYMLCVEEHGTVSTQTMIIR